MSLFKRKKKQRPIPEVHEPQQWELSSIMQTIARTPDSLKKPDEIEEAILRDEEITECEAKLADGCVVVSLTYRAERYTAAISPIMAGPYPDFVLNAAAGLSEQDKESLRSALPALNIVLDFGRDALESYHLQLKLASLLADDLLAVCDETAEKLLSGKFVASAAGIKTPPSPINMFTVHAVAGEDDTVWLHTHGLIRCGHCELEVLGCTRENSTSCCTVLNAYASRMIEGSDRFDISKPNMIGMLDQETPLAVIGIEWNKALCEFPEDINGGIADRIEGHNSRSNVIFAIDPESTPPELSFVPLTKFSSQLDENPLIYFTNAETARMKALAAERIGYVIDRCGQEDTKILLKIALRPDEFDETDPNYEHIWFGLNYFRDGVFNAELTQQPYYVSTIKPGDCADFTVEDITDWRIYCPNGEISPDLVYLLD